MTILSWNVNGLRAVERNGYWKDFLKLSPDIFLFQEIKAEADQLPDDVREVDGYHAYFNPSRARKGYSGTATYTKRKPKSVEYGLGIEKFDDEGRTLITYFDDFVIYNVYFPNGGQGNKRVPFKLDFYDAFLEHAELNRRKGLGIVIAGDVNTAHEEIDLARPKENEDNTGFLPEERAWIDEVIRAGYIDTFRHFYPDKRDAYSYWDMKTHARERNVGWRLDYIFISPNLVSKLKNARIHTNVYGSDHCPVSIELA